MSKNARFLTTPELTLSRAWKKTSKISSDMGEPFFFEVSTLNHVQTEVLDRLLEASEPLKRPESLKALKLLKALLKPEKPLTTQEAWEASILESMILRELEVEASSVALSEALSEARDEWEARFTSIMEARDEWKPYNASDKTMKVVKK